MQALIFSVVSNIRHMRIAAIFLLLSAVPAFSEETCRQEDVVVYGGTPAGIAAAIQAARLNKSVLLLEPTAHVGGMMSNGLTKTDASPRLGVYGGIVAEFFKKATKRYKLTDPIRTYFESKWAEETFVGMLQRAGVHVVYNQRIKKLARGAKAIRRITMVSGRTFCGNVFINAGYEGDLMKLSGVDTVIGRESTKQYGESLAGVGVLQKPSPGRDRTPITVDPYVVAGDPSSGLLPGISTVGQ